MRTRAVARERRAAFASTAEVTTKTPQPGPGTGPNVGVRDTAPAPGSSESAPPPPPRAVIEGIRPTVDGGALPAKATVGLPLRVSATVFADGHDLLLVWVRHGPPEASPANGARAAMEWTELPLQHLGNDHWEGWLTPERIGPWAFDIVGLPDEYGSWLRDLRLRYDAGQNIEVEIEEGALMAEKRAATSSLPAGDRKALGMLASNLRAGLPGERLLRAELPESVDLMARTADRSRATFSGPLPLWVDRELAGFSAWYEMFPRSEGVSRGRSGTLRSAAKRLPAIAEMGFDIVYLPPVHPIGTTARKGPNNTETAGPHDVGSPWAIGSREGGHTALHADLGSFADFDAFVAEARRAGLEVALDYALQCSPDHPWVSEHPEWFRHRPDGSIRYAENPPKRYQDIFPINFDTPDWRNLWEALHDIVTFWIGHGVRIFRVDNPHTKPLAFWEWLIGRVQQSHPDIIFLAEAFTRPAMMQRLAKIGFTQSYTYFTWRNSKWELSQYLVEVSQSEQASWFRPNFWVNTPDILHETLQQGGRPAFHIRAALAAITCPSWGMYSGYELLENIAVREGSEEYLHSEKYELRPRNWHQADSLAPFISTLNTIRQRHRRAVAQLSTLHVHHIDNDNMLCVSRSSAERDDVLLLVVNLDPFAVHEATTWLDLEHLGLAGDQSFTVRDELTGNVYDWRGPANYVRLDPTVLPAHVFHLSPTGAR